MLFRLLGLIEASVDGMPLPIGGPRQRSVLADLVLHADRTVATTQLIDDIWGEHAPASATHTVETYISRLRQVLGAPGSDAVVVTRPTGYVLATSPDSVDVWQFRDLAAQGNAAADRGDAESAASLLADALALWRGPALADIRHAPFATVTAEALGREQLTVVERLMDARLSLGQHAAIVPELEHLVGESPYRERLHAQLMIALYRCGQQAEALAAFRNARNNLVSDLGIEPGPELRDLELAILRHSSELQAPPRTPSEGRGTPTARNLASRPSRPLVSLPASAQSQHNLASARARARWRPLAGHRIAQRWALAAAIIVAAGVAVPVVVTAGAANSAPLADAVGQLSTGGYLTRRIDLPGLPDTAVSADGSLWVASAEQDIVYRVSPVTDAVVQSITVGSGPTAITADGGDIWVANTLDGTVSRINAGVDRVVQTIPVGAEPTGLAVGGGRLWVTDAASSTLLGLNLASGQPSTRISLPDPSFGVAVGAGSVWISSPTGNSVIRVSLTSGVAGRPIRVGSGPTAITFGLGAVWTANSLDSTVSRIDPTTGRSTTIPAGDGVDALVVSGSVVWAADRLDSTLTRIDGRTGGAGPPVRIGGTPVALATVGGSVWVAVGPSANPPAPQGTLRVVSSLRPSSIDPALQYPSMGPVFGQSTYDTLVTFQKSGGSAGLQIVPDLAIGMPAVSGDGTVYTFTLRPGLRYSDGEPVRAQDFRYAIERVMTLNADAASFLDGIMGASACSAKRRCDLSRGIIVDDSARTITFLLTAPDPDFLYKLAFGFTAPVPASVPDHDSGRHPVPGTGPFMVSRYIPGREAVFARNPYFREWSAAAQPASSLAGIVWTFGYSTGREAAAIEAGRADWTSDPLSDVAGLIARYPAQVHVNPTPEIVYTAFNTQAAPFSDPRVRQAFSLAANRASFVDKLGGADLAAPTCQILPPGIPGYVPYCPFTTDPGPSGAWVGPDLTQARQLVDASGTEGMGVTVWSDDLAPDPTTGAFTVSVLDELGYHAVLRILAPAALQQEVNDSRNDAQATDGSWLADYPSASDFFDFFRCSAFKLADPADTRNGAFFCDPSADQLMNQADAEQVSDPVAAARSWAAVDRGVTNAAPWVPLAIVNNVDFLSARVTNYQYNLFFGIVLDQLRISSALSRAR